MKMKVQAWNKMQGSPLSSGPSARTGFPNGSLNTLESLKNRLLNERLGAKADAELTQRLRYAADESASLAWASGFPLLALPELLAEKLQEAHRRFERQRAIQSRSRHVLQFAA